jgi:hypothetical protein
MKQSAIVNLFEVAVNKIDSTALLFWGTELDFGKTEKAAHTVVMVYPMRDSMTNSKVSTQLTIKVKMLDSSNSTNIARKELGDLCRDFAFKLFDLMQDLEPAHLDPNSFQGNNEYNIVPKHYTNYSFTCNFIDTYSRC